MSSLVFNQNFFIAKAKNIKVVNIIFKYVSRTVRNFTENYIEGIIPITEYLDGVNDYRRVAQFNFTFENSIITPESCLNNKIHKSIKLLNSNYSYLNFLNYRLNILNRINYLNSQFYYKKRVDNVLFPDRRVLESKNLMYNLPKNSAKYYQLKVYKNFKSYWWSPAKYEYNLDTRDLTVGHRNDFNRILLNNIINLILPEYLRVFFNIFRHFNKLTSKRVMLLYLNDYNFFNFFMKKKYNQFTIKWFNKFNKTLEEPQNEMFYYTNYLRPTMLRTTIKNELVKLCKNNRSYMFGWLYIFSLQELLKKIDTKLLFFLKFVRLMKLKKFKLLKHQTRKLFLNSPIHDKDFMVELVSVVCMSIMSKDSKFLFDFLFKYFNTMHFRIQFRFISFLKNFLRKNFFFFTYYYKLRGIRIILKGKIGKTGSVRKKKVILSFGKYGYSNLHLRMDEYSGPMFTPTGVIGARVIITY